VRQVGYLPELYEDARSEKIIIKKTSYSIIISKFKPDWSVPTVKSTSAGRTILSNPSHTSSEAGTKTRASLNVTYRRLSHRACVISTSRKPAVSLYQDVRNTMETDKNKSCECWTRGNYDMSAYFALPVPIVLLQKLFYC